MAPAKKGSKERASGGKAKAAASHPSYEAMAQRAISTLKEHKGSSRQAILKYIMANFKVGTNVNAVNSRLKLALRRGTATGVLKHIGQGTGASGRFQVGEEKKSTTVPKNKQSLTKKAGGTAATTTTTKKKKRSPKTNTTTAAVGAASTSDTAELPTPKKPSAKKATYTSKSSMKPKSSKGQKAKATTAKRPVAKKKKALLFFV